MRHTILLGFLLAPLGAVPVSASVDFDDINIVLIITNFRPLPLEHIAP